jgi:hypothetical protein
MYKRSSAELTDSPLTPLSSLKTKRVCDVQLELQLARLIA